MSFRHRARTLAAAASAAGVVLLGVAVGGMASVDRELSAATAPAPAAPAGSLQVVYEVDTVRSAGDCPERRRGGPSDASRSLRARGDGRHQEL
jgi:hypothetical protein